MAPYSEEVVRSSLVTRLIPQGVLSIALLGSASFALPFVSSPRLLPSAPRLCGAYSSLRMPSPYRELLVW